MHLFTRKNKDSFWSKVRKLNRPSSSSLPSVIDGVSGNSNIANVFASNWCILLNTHSTSQCDSLYTSFVLSVSSLDIVVTDEDVIQAIHCLKSGKSDDANNMFSEHFKYASHDVINHVVPSEKGVRSSGQPFQAC